MAFKLKPLHSIVESNSRAVPHKRCSPSNTSLFGIFEKKYFLAFLFDVHLFDNFFFIVISTNSDYFDIDFNRLRLCNMYRLSSLQSAIMEIQERRDEVETMLILSFIRN